MNTQNIQINAQLALQAVEQAARNQIAKEANKRKQRLQKLSVWKLVKTLVVEALTEALNIVVERNPRVAKTVKVLTVTASVVKWIALAPIRLVRWVRAGGPRILARNAKRAALTGLEVGLLWTALAPIRLVKWVLLRGIWLAIWVALKAVWKTLRWIGTIGSVREVTVLGNEGK